MPSQFFNQDKELAEFFTDVEYLRDKFKNAVAAPRLTKRLLVIHGVGGVGKSSLLRMFRLHCKSVSVPVALASGDDSKSALDVLARWTEDLKADSVAFPAFGKSFEHYRAIQAKVDEQAKKAAGGRAADIAGKAASKTAEAAGGALAGAAIGSVIPGIGTAIGGALGGVLGGMGAEALVDWMRGFLKQPDIDLLLDPAKKLTDDFLADAANAAGKQRIVLMLDTFEQMTALDDWARDIAQRLHANALFVIVGRAMVNWGRAWPSWLGQAQVEELKPMTKRVMHELVQRYYRYATGGKEPDHKQVEAIIEFSRGLPMFINTAVHQWVFYQGDFQSAKPKVMEDIVKRLREGMPRELYSILDAAAVVRWFNTEILCAVTDQADVSVAYQELQRFPFVRSRAEGLALHDAVRDILGENLRLENPARHRELHERAAAYFEARHAKASSDESERLGLERLYHRVRADEEAGIKLFQEMAEELVRYRLVNRLRALLNDANTYPLERENSRLWREYYNARLAHLEDKKLEAEEVYKRLGNKGDIEPQLYAYALCDWGEVYATRERAGKGAEQAIQILERSLKTTYPLDSKLIFVYSHLRGVYIHKGEWKQAVGSLERQLEFFQKNRDGFGIVVTLAALKGTYGLIGDWKKAFDTLDQGIQTLKTMPENRFPRMRLQESFWFSLWSGRYYENEQIIRDALEFAQQVGDVNRQAGYSRGLGLVLGMQEKFHEASCAFSESLKKYKEIGIDDSGGTRGFLGVILVKQGELEKAEENLIQSLSIKRELLDRIGIPELLVGLGELYELRYDLAQATSYYLQTLDLNLGRCNFECGALTGLVRVKHAQGDYTAIPPLLAEAEQLAQQYEYNDHLASLRLTQAHLTCAGRGDVVSPARQGEMTSPLQRYQHALIYALRYNRFLLDAVLSGRPQGTPLHPIIPYCLERGEEGRQMLIALRDWWQTGVNDIGTPRPDTISPIPEGIALLEAEHIAREREPGDGSPQKSVVEQIERALAGQ